MVRRGIFRSFVKVVRIGGIRGVMDRGELEFAGRSLFKPIELAPPNHVINAPRLSPNR